MLIRSFARAKCLQLVHLLTIIVLVSSCRSVYEGQKLDADGNLSGAEGIPYVLPRPEYALKRDPMTPGRYTVEVAYVPDPSQRYTLRLDPAITSQVGFDLDLGSGGELTSAEGKLTDQIVPTFKALASVVLSTLGVVLMKTAPPDQPFCEGEQTPARVAHCAIQQVAACPDSIKKRIESDFFGAGKAEPDKADVLAKLHYLNPGERQCLSNASDYLRNLADASAKSLKVPFEDSTSDTAATRAFKRRVASLIDAADTTGMRRVVVAIDQAIVTGDQDWYVLLRRELGAEVKPSAEELQAWRDLLRRAGLWGIEEGEQKQLPGEPVEALARAGRIAAGLQAIVDLDVDAWRGRHIAYLDDRIAERLLALLQSGSPVEPQDDPTIRDWRQQIAVTAYKGDEYDRLLRLVEKLDDLPLGMSPSVRISPFEEYGRLRAEVLRAEAEIALAAETLVAAAQAGAPEVTPELPLHVPRVPAVCVAESTANGWIYGKGAAAPEFVVVLERPGKGVVAASASGEKCPWQEYW